MKKALVIGATGMLGYCVALKLHENGWIVKGIGKESLVDESFFSHGIEYCCGDFYDEFFLTHALKNVDKVFYFLSSTFPVTSSDSLELEISRTLYGLDYLLRKMRDLGVKDIVFPSSGGTIYGNVENGIAREDYKLNPTTPYGIGKAMCEEILRFYSKFGISATILRVGNVYGYKMIRTTAQGVIDLFVQKAINREIATVWGEALNDVRDYIFTDDFAEGVARIADIKHDGVEVYNLSSGVGTSLNEIVDEINKIVNPKMVVKCIKNDSVSEIKRIVLDTSKIREKTGWMPQYDIKSGIKETVRRKCLGGREQE